MKTLLHPVESFKDPLKDPRVNHSCYRVHAHLQKLSRDRNAEYRNLFQCIVTDLRMSPKTVAYCIKQLKSLGYIRESYKHGRRVWVVIQSF